VEEKNENWHYRRRADCGTLTRRLTALGRLVTIPEKNIPNLAGLFADTPDRVVVVDTGNYYPRQRDGRIEAIEASLPESKWVAQQLGRPVIKAFNNIYAKHLLELGRPKGTPGLPNFTALFQL
jgi:predicted dinucleotide-binding enzyme